MKASKRHRGSRGVATILVVGVVAVFLIFFLVVGIDFAYIYVVRGQMQNAADAAALAGAAVLTPLIDDVSSAYEQEDAREETWVFACKNFAAGDPVYLVSGAGSECDDPPPPDLNDSNADGGDIIVGHWDADTGFTRATGTTGLLINAVKVVARRTADSPDTGGPVSLFFGHLVDWPVMGVSRIAIASRKPLDIAATPLCLPSCDKVTPLTITPPNITPGERFFFRVKDGSPNISWSSFLEKNTSQPVISAYIRGDKVPPPICKECIFTTEGIITPTLCEVRKRIRKDGDTYNVGGVDIFGWKAIIPILPPTPCPTAKGTGCITADPGYQPGDPYEVIEFSEIIITDAVPPGNCPGDPGPYASGKPGIVILGTGPGVALVNSTIGCLDCNVPGALGTEDRATLVR